MYTHTFLISLLAGLAASSPIETRQLIGGTGSSSSEFSSGGCRDVLFAWARGSTEIGNMVRFPLPPHSYPKKKQRKPL
jgi:cutinase